MKSKGIFLALVLSWCICALPVLASWWWPFGSSERKKIGDPDDMPKVENPNLKKYIPNKEEDQVSVAHLEKLAKAGNTNAQLTLGRIYFEGRAGEKQSYDKAFRYYKMAAEQDNAQAMFNVGLCYDAGYGVKKNPDEAVRWYYRAADGGVPEAQANASIIAEQRGDYESARKYLKMLSTRGNTAAMRKLALLLSTGLGGPTEYEEAASWLKEASSRGDSRAQVKLADCYQTGLGVERNYQEMVNWLTLAAQDGDPEAQAKLGFCFQNGLGIGKNADAAFTWYKLSAAAGYATGQVYLGNCYRDGYGTSYNPAEAFNCYKKAAASGEAIGEFSLAAAYHDGIGTDIQMVEAEKWMRLAAEKGLSLAQVQMGMFLSGKYQEIPQNLEEARQWFEKASAQYDPSGMVQLALCCIYGYGGPVDRQRAEKLLASAAETGDRQAIHLYEEHFKDSSNK